MNPVISKALQAKTSPFFNTFFYARFVTEGRPTEGVQVSTPLVQDRKREFSLYPTC